MITILDGGMGRELERIGAPFRQPEWSALALMEKPDAVKDVHKNFINAGANIITTNSYAVVPHHIGQDRFDQQGAELIKLSAEIARNAANETGGDTKIAACIPPLFGSYQPESFDSSTAPALIAPFFEQQAEIADIFLAETLSSWEEARFASKNYQSRGINRPLWLAYTLHEQQPDPDNILLRSGEKLYDVLERSLQETPASAILFNCCAVEDIAPALDIFNKLNPHSNLACGVYANAFTRTPKRREATVLSTIRDDITPDVYAGYAKTWADAGATIIGGCCGISPGHIQKLSKTLL